METKIKDRGWVKNVAIVFLAVMLVLTFFSNTIMNRSLPEVATQEIRSNTITAQVRGTGKVSASQNYEVKLDQTRTVKSVMVKVGQEVNAGDVLFVLADMDSDELEAAQDNLRQLSTSYQKALINATESDYAKENRDIQRARENLEEAERKRDSLEISDLDISMAETGVTVAKEKVKDAQKKVDRAQEELDDIGGKVDTDDATLRSLKSAMNAKKAAWDAAKDELESAMLIYGAEYEEIEAAAERAIRESDEFKEKYEDKSEKEQKSYIEGKLSVYMPYIVDKIVNEGMTLSQAAIGAEMIPDGDGPAPEESAAEQGADPIADPPASEPGDKDDTMSDEAKKYKKAYDEITACKDAVDKAKSEYDSAKSAYNRALSDDNSGEYNSASRDLKKAQDELKAAEEQQAEAEERLTKAKEKKTEYDAAVENAKTCQTTLEDLVFALSEQQKTDNKNAQLERLDLQDLAAQLGKAQQKVNELRDDTTDKEIKAEVPGIIESISITAGNKTTPDTPLATIELPDMGYTMSFSVTNEQARLIHTGDSATVSNYYYGSEITATVSSIKTDPKNPQTSKLVTFDVTGDVNVGSDLTVSVGQRSQEYDFVVPNSALRSDTNGDFVLVITAKNSPLGNRYIATRVDVTKIASDDTNTAVTGGLNRGDFVITTSTKPIENGQQVRMQDTQQQTK